MAENLSRLSNYIPNVHLQDYIQVIWRRRWIMITFFIVLVTTVTIGTLRQTPIYEATATLLIEHKSPQVISMQEVTSMGPGDYGAYKDYYETQYKLIKSSTLLKEVAGLLGLKTDNPSIYSNSVEKLQKSIRVNPVRNSQLVEITAEDSSPEMAAKTANILADEYIRQNLERNLNTANKASQWLTNKIEEQRQKLKDVEMTLQKYREEHNISILPEVTNEYAAEDIKAEYAKSQAMLANYSQRYTDEHPKIIELKAQIDSLKSKIQGLEDIDDGDNTMEYRVLEREVQTNKRMYEILLTRLKEIDLSGTLNVNNISIVDRASAPARPAKPKIMLNIILAVIVGLAGGTGLGFFVDYLDTTIKSPEDIKEILGFNCLGAIPDIIEEKNELKRDKIVMHSPHSVIAEAYRSIRTEISQVMVKEEQAKAILITSAEPQAGKTITSSNLGLVFSQLGNRVVLVDCDLRKPQMDRIFNLNREQGVTEYLWGTANVDSIIKNTEVENLKIITSGKLPRNPAEVISSERMKELISELRFRFDFIFFDSPPVISVTDAVILADMLDGFIWVVRSGSTPVPLAIQAKERLERVKAKKVGIVLNGMSVEHGNYYYYYRYYHYYGEEHKSRREQQKVNVDMT